MADRKPNTLQIEIHAEPVNGDYGDTILALIAVADMMVGGAVSNASVLLDDEGNEIGMACMVYREPGSHRGGK